VPFAARAGRIYNSRQTDDAVMATSWHLTCLGDVQRKSEARYNQSRVSEIGCASGKGPRSAGLGLEPAQTRTTLWAESNSVPEEREIFVLA